jgi:protein gp37
VSDKSAIEWTDATWNPVTGCTKVSPGCDHCYAETFAERFRGVAGHHFEQGFDVVLRPERLEIPMRWRRPRRVFVNSMSDLFHARVPEAFIRDVLAVMADTPAHTYQVLTKRPRRAADLDVTWPPNVWLGVSVESDRYDWRAQTLADTPAAVRFISAEPLLGPLPHLDLSGIGWVIAGGESGPGYRPPEAAWFRDLRDRCTAANVPFFFKQWGGPTPKAGGRLLDGRTWNQMPATTLTSHGGAR